MCIRDRYQRRVRGLISGTMEAKIKDQLGDRDPEYVFQLMLDSTKCQKVEGLEPFKCLEILSMNSCGLSSLSGFPKLEKLRELNIADNKLGGADLKILQASDLHQLRRLVLAGNTNIKSLEELEPLASIPSLRSLDLYECEVTKNEEYREQVFTALRSLVYLDGTDRDGNEEDDEEEEDELEEEVMTLADF
eukprot:TRINITY_DN745_c0_g1_i4.p1 TRINITY_DN745_c0_g1~~TRINITY_DN745_c0_g1_i4.p1  ORF type:complete len:191 (-),score=71.32 TRINITY_DN745_c0_g1_i4:805-1377(-)